MDPPTGHEKDEGDDDDEEEEPQSFIRLAPKTAKNHDPGNVREEELSGGKENNVGDEESNLMMGGSCEKKAFCLLDGIFEVIKHAILTCIFVFMRPPCLSVSYFCD
jgi:hypothetical protein